MSTNFSSPSSSTSNTRRARSIRPIAGCIYACAQRTHIRTSYTGRPTKDSSDRQARVTTDKVARLLFLVLQFENVGGDGGGGDGDDDGDGDAHASLCALSAVAGEGAARPACPSLRMSGMMRCLSARRRRRPRNEECNNKG